MFFTNVINVCDFLFSGSDGGTLQGSATAHSGYERPSPFFWGR